MLGTVLAVIISVLILEAIVRFIFPRPLRWLEPQVRIELANRIGYRNRPNQNAFCGDKTCTINSLGFRGSEIHSEREVVDHRILGLGNSLTFGGGVADDESYLAYLNHYMNKRYPDECNEVINGAIIAFTIRQYVPFLESVVPTLKPDIVLLGAHWRDLHFHPRFGQLKKKVDDETWQMIQKKFRETIEERWTTTSTKEKVVKKIKHIISYWRTLYVGNYYLQALRQHIKPPNFMLWQTAFLSGEETEPIRQRKAQAKKTLSQMKRICEKNDTKFALVIFPDYKQIRGKFPKSIWPSLLIETCEELDIQYIHLLPTIQRAYKKYGRSILIPYDVTHYSALGNQAIAEALFEFLNKVRFLEEDKSLDVAAA